MFQVENDPTHSQETAPDSFTDCEDITPTQIIPALLENKVNVDVHITDCESAIINTNKPPQGELFQDELAKQVINIDEYKKDKQLFVVIPADYVASEDLPIQIKEVERVVSNNIEHVKNTFDEVTSQFIKALQSPIRVKSEDIPIIIPTDIPVKIKPIDVDDNHFDVTQDIIKEQREKSNASLLVASNADEEVVLCSVDGNVKKEQDENEHTYCENDLPSQENIAFLSGNDVTFTKVSNSSDEEFTPKKSKRFTFTDSDLPDSDEIRDILMSYPQPTVVESFSESESENSSEDEFNVFLCRHMNKIEPDTKIDLTRMIGIEKLPERVMTRLRTLKPSYLTKQEDQMDEDIILENIKRLKSFKKEISCKASKNHESIKEGNTPRKETDNKSNEHRRKVKVEIGKPERKGKKTKTFARKNTIEYSLELNSISAARRTRSMKKENDGKNTQNKCIFPGNKNKKPDHRRKPYKTERTIFPEIEVRRSKRRQKVKEKNDNDAMKAPIKILKKSIPNQRNSRVYNVSSSSTESPKSLKKSLVIDSDVPSPKRTRSYNKSINNASLRATPARVVKTPYEHLSAFPGKEHKQDKMNPYVLLARYEPAQKRQDGENNRNFLTRSQLARRRFHRACKRTREVARTSTKRL